MFQLTVDGVRPPQLCAPQPTFLPVGAACEDDSWCATENCVSVTKGRSGVTIQICLPQTCASPPGCPDSLRAVVRQADADHFPIAHLDRQSVQLVLSLSIHVQPFPGHLFGYFVLAALVA